MTDKKIILHIGYPKTATTTLQKNLFEKEENINNLSKYVGGSDISKKNLKLKYKKEKTNLISNESILDFRNDYLENTKRIIKKIKEIGKNISVIVVVTIRNQKELVQSSFSFWIDYFKEKGYSDINKMVKEEIHGEQKTGIKKWMDYYLVSKSIFDELNKDRDQIKILQYENMCYNEKKFYKELSNIINVEDSKILKNLKSGENRNVSRVSKEYTKHNYIYRKLSIMKAKYFPRSSSVNRLPLGRKIKKMMGYFNKKITLKNESKELIKKEYEIKNKKLAKLFGLKLHNDYNLRNKK